MPTARNIIHLVPKNLWAVGATMAPRANPDYCGLRPGWPQATMSSKSQLVSWCEVGSESLGLESGALRWSSRDMDLFVVSGEPCVHMLQFSQLHAGTEPKPQA